jgi:hypothetical protein
MNNDFQIIREHLANGDKSSDAPLAALSRIEQALDVSRNNADCCYQEIDDITAEVWHFMQDELGTPVTARYAELITKVAKYQDAKVKWEGRMGGLWPTIETNETDNELVDDGGQLGLGA